MCCRCQGQIAVNKYLATAIMPQGIHATSSPLPLTPFTNIFQFNFFHWYYQLGSIRYVPPRPTAQTYCDEKRARKNRPMNNSIYCTKCTATKSASKCLSTVYCPLTFILISHSTYSTGGSKCLARVKETTTCWQFWSIHCHLLCCSLISHLLDSLLIFRIRCDE